MSKKKLLAIAACVSAVAVFMSGCGCGGVLPSQNGSGLGGSGELGSSNTSVSTGGADTLTEREIYRSDFSVSAERFSGVNGSTISVVDINGEKVLKCSNRNNWWEQVSLDISDLVQGDCDYEVRCQILHCGSEKADCTIEWEDSGDSNNIFVKSLRAYYANPDEWAELFGYSYVPTVNSPVINFRQVGNADFYVKNVVVRLIDIDSTTAVMQASLKESAEKHGIVFGTIIGDDRLDDSDYGAYIDKHCASVSCGNYGYIDYAATVAAAKLDPDAMPVVCYDLDKYYDYASAHGLTVRGPALMHDGSQYEWLFHEEYDESKSYVTADVMKRRMKSYIFDLVTHLETKYPNLARSYDGINECVDLGDGAYTDGDDCCIRRQGNGWYTVLGKDYVKYAYSYAREALNSCGSSAKLFYNDWGCNISGKRNAILNMANWLNDGNMLDGVNLPHGTKLLDGMGMEGYRSFDSTKGAIAYELLDDDVNSEALAVRLYNEAGLEVNYSELTFKNSDDSEQGRMTHARYIYAWFKTLLKANATLRAEGLDGITLINMWGMFDCPYLLENDYSTGLTGTHCGVLDYKYGVKPEFYALSAALNDKAFPCD